jgi:uncharacterized protein (UPF0276 family)
MNKARVKPTSPSKNDVGLGLRSSFLEWIDQRLINPDFFEILPDNLLPYQAGLRDQVKKVRKNYSMTSHSLAMNLVSPDRVNKDYLLSLHQLYLDLDIQIFSDHLCWTRSHSHSSFDLLPFPFTAAVLSQTVDNIKRAEDIFGSSFGIENISTYLRPSGSEFSEAEFTCKVLDQTQAWLLLDVNNLYVNSFNHQESATDFLQMVPTERIGMIHLAGHISRESFLIDTHSREVAEPVWDLYEEAIKLHGPQPTLIEWDDDYPEPSVLQAHIERARSVNRDHYESAIL